MIERNTTTEQQDNSKPNAAYKEIEVNFFDSFSDKDITYSYRMQRPTPAQYERATSTLGSGKKNVSAMRTLCLDCIHPDDRERLVSDVQTYPGLIATLGGRLLTSCGVAGN